MFSLPAELNPDRIVPIWESAGNPGIDHWLGILTKTGKYKKVKLTKAKLLHSLRAGIQKLGFNSITEYRERKKKPVVSALENNEDEEQIIPLTETDDGAYIESRSETIRNQDELISKCKINMEIWEVDPDRPSIVKSYQVFRKKTNKDITWSEGKADGYVSDQGDVTIVTLYSVKVHLIPKQIKPFKESLEDLMIFFKTLPKEKPIKLSHSEGEHLLILSVLDAHFSRRSLDNTYTPEKAQQDFTDTVDALLSRAMGMSLPISEILIPAGQDFLNTDNLKETTTKGTPQQNSADTRVGAKYAVQSYIYMINRAVQIAPVYVYLVEDNHSKYSTYWLGLTLYHWAQNHKYAEYIHIDNNIQPRKYHHYGQNLIGMEHGDEVKADKLPLIMATEEPKLWGETKYRTVLRGHFHTERTMLEPISSQNGVTIETFPAFCPPNEWERLMGYIGSHRRADGLFYHKEFGPAGRFSVFVDELGK